MTLKSRLGGKGLSEKDMSAIMEVLHHPKFDIKNVPYKTGRGYNLWLRKKLEAANGPLEVIVTILKVSFLVNKLLSKTLKVNQVVESQIERNFQFNLITMIQ